MSDSYTFYCLFLCLILRSEVTDSVALLPVSKRYQLFILDEHRGTYTIHSSTASISACLVFVAPHCFMVLYIYSSRALCS